MDDCEARKGGHWNKLQFGCRVGDYGACMGGWLTESRWSWCKVGLVQQYDNIITNTIEEGPLATHQPGAAPPKIG